MKHGPDILRRVPRAYTISYTTPKQAEIPSG
jgi:hypothetical protein